MKDFRMKATEINDLAKKYFDSFVIVGNCNTKEQTSIAVKGNTQEMLYLTRELIKSIREAIEPKFGKECTEELLKSTLLTEDELKYEVKKQVDEIPAWLKNLMDLNAEEDDDDAEDEQDDSDDDSDEDGDDTEAEDEARRKAIDELINALRGGISGHGSFDVSLRSK